MERKLLPGKKIRQEKLAKDLGISRTPLINAFKYLEHEKLIEAIPRRGFFVRLFTKQEMINIFELREVLEGLSARRMASQITNTQIIKLNGFFKQFANSSDIKDVKAYAKEDRRFHDFVTSVGSNEFIKSILESYNIISYSYQLVNFEGLVRPPNETINEHLAIIERISKRDSEVAE
jgi:DNA-binding GntR family transcriptional regulator